MTSEFKPRPKWEQDVLTFGIPCVCGHRRYAHATDFWYRGTGWCEQCTCRKMKKDHAWVERMKKEQGETL